MLLGGTRDMDSNRKSAGKLLAAGTSFVAALIFGAAALAQTPSPVPSTTPDATSVATGTSVVTSTAVTTGTAVAVPTSSVPNSVYVPGGTGNFAFADTAFQAVWNRTDSLVAAGSVARTWFWGPGPNTPGLYEQYNQGANKQRLVQYFDKSRMEINNPSGDRTQSFFVTNGLLTVELISGFIQVGDQDFVKYRPACIPMSGDFGDTNAPTYFAFQSVSNTQAGDHNATDRTGKNATDTIDRDGKTGTDESKASVPGVAFVHFENNHNIPRVFWDFLNSSGPVKNAQGQTVNEQLINPWFFASGLPISEAYWAKAKIQGELKDVLIQAYERRVLTYVPSNQAGFQVEMGNIGQHYFDWRYRNYGYCPADVVTTPTPPAVAPTPTTGAPGTPRPTSTAGGPTAIPTVFPPVATATQTSTPRPPTAIPTVFPPVATPTNTEVKPTDTPGPIQTQTQTTP
jgi:hypothetical protein